MRAVFISQSEHTMPLGLRLASLLARASGYAHDLGKSFQMFQDKLKSSTPLADPVRHEWISMQLLMRGLLDKPDSPWSEAWSSACESKQVIPYRKLSEIAGLKGGLSNEWATFLYLVYSHHRLPMDSAIGSDFLNEKTYVREDGPGHPLLRPAAMPSAQTLGTIRHVLERTKVMASSTSSAMGSDPVAWRAVATLARMALILADHSVSGVDLSSINGHGASLAGQAGVAFANTVVDAAGKRKMNQELNWHLSHVGDEAGKMIARMMAFSPPGVSSDVRQALRATSEKALTDPAMARFSWQPRNARLLASLQATAATPTLVLNIAGTGCGKTRANVLFVDALRKDEPLRLATGLNLRTLTLQTRDAYAQQMGMGQGDLSCVIGNEIAQRLHESRSEDQKKSQANKALEPAASRSEIEDEDGNLFEDAFEAVGESDPPPQWLEGFLARKPKLRSVIMAPVLSCTIDFLVKAGDPTQQGNHALTMLRLLRSDLVLDEIDSYDPKALASVMRLVTAAAMWGRHVVASSATLSAPVAKALCAAFELGLKMGRSLGLVGFGPGRQVLIDDVNEAAVASFDDAEAFSAWYEQEIIKRCLSMPKRSLRKAELIDFPVAGKSKVEAIHAAREAISMTCLKMHARHAWDMNASHDDSASNGPHMISFGLVRIANITQAVNVAKYLCQSLAETSEAKGPGIGVHVACYHSQMPRMHRHAMEVVLDGVLQRGPSNTDVRANLMSHPAVEQAIRADIEAGKTQTLFIVVATPVEEIGRDHDFDWGVFEPSSSQSLVQASGRINRHRMVNVTEPNVAVMRFNFAKLAGRAVCFSMPGLESKENHYGSQDMKNLINWEALEAAGQIDARLRYLNEIHLFAGLDNKSSEAQIKSASRRFMRSDRDLWMGANTYRLVQVREGDEKEVWSRDDRERFIRQEQIGQHGWQVQWMRRAVEAEESPEGAWLSWSTYELFSMADDIGIARQDALSVEVRPATGKRSLRASEAFGWYLS